MMSIKFQGSVIREQDVTFAIVIVKKHILNSTSEANESIRSFAPVLAICRSF
jgi:hypothetical protein